MTVVLGEDEQNRGFFDSVLAGLSELVYVCDVETYELVYVNEPG